MVCSVRWHPAKAIAAMQANLVKGHVTDVTLSEAKRAITRLHPQRAIESAILDRFADVLG